MSHQELRRSLASYVLGALGPAERRELEAHLAGCTDCREELASYAGLPGLLSRLELAEAVGATLLPPPSLLPSVLAAVESERSGRRRSLSRWRLTAAGLAVAAAVTGVLALIGGPSAPASERPLVAAAGVSSRGSVALQARPWGTELHLRLQDLPAAGGYAAYAVDERGVRTIAATWGPTTGDRVEVPGATALGPDALSELVIETADGSELLLMTAGG